MVLMLNEMKDPQVGYVIEIPNEKTVIVNVGADDGFSEGDKFIIYEEGPEVIDSKTKENLGRKDFTKSTVQIVELYPKFSVCQRIVTRDRSSIASVAAMVQGVSHKEVVVLPINSEQNKNWSISNPNIEINDPIKIA